MKIIFTILSFTWGILMTFIGFVVALALICVGKRPEKYGFCWHFTVGKNWGGVNLGIVFLTDPSANDSTKSHELGHGIQNCIFGPFMPFVIGIPSAIRYNYRNIKYDSKGLQAPTPYHSIWFERSASELGEKFMETATK